MSIFPWIITSEKKFSKIDPNERVKTTTQPFMRAIWLYEIFDQLDRQSSKVLYK